MIPQPLVKRDPSPKRVVKLQRAWRFRLYPTPVQIAELDEWMRQLKILWNLAHEQRLQALQRPRGERPRISYYSQSREMTQMLPHVPQLELVLCSIRQEVLRDLDKAWQRYFRMPDFGRPRFKGRSDRVSLYFSTTKHWRVMPGYLSLTGAASSVGAIRIRQDRDWPKGATFSSCRIVRDGEEWYGVFPLLYEAEVEQAKPYSVGINRGVVHALADSDGRVVDSPRYYERTLDLIARRQHDIDRSKKGRRHGFKNRHKAIVRLGKVHQRIRRKREWFLHQQSAHYAKNYSLIGIEDWSIKKMTSSEPTEEMPRGAKRVLNRSILDVGWYELGRQIQYKSEAAGGRMVAVPSGKMDPGTLRTDPAPADDEEPVDTGGDDKGISSSCSVCGAPLKRAVSGRRKVRCEDCENRELGDVNAACNVLLRAQLAKPPSPKRPKVSIKIKGRVKAQTVTAGNPPEEACLADPIVNGRNDPGKVDREVDTPNARSC